MVSKGVIAYAYIAVAGCTVEFGVPKNTITKSQVGAWSQDHLEVEKRNIPDGYVGRFYLKVIQNGKIITYQYNEINSLTGNLSGGTMTSIRNTKSIKNNGLIIAYGFYDAGSGKEGLTNKDQCWVTVTPDRSDWMSAVAPSGSTQANKPFSTFALPCPHDCGMNSMQSSDLVLQSKAIDFLAAALQNIPLVGAVLSSLLRYGATSSLVSNIIYGLAITQKDSIEDMLAIGARYFEFRPGRFPKQAREVSGLGDGYYFMHACIPGISYQEFLERVLAFLEQHSQEIIVIQLRGDGILKEIEQPTKEEKAKTLGDALAKYPGIIAGTELDMTSSTVQNLRDQKKRLIVVDEISQYSSYNDKDYATLDGSTIVKALNSMNTKDQAGHPMTVLQCQATATSVMPALKYSIVSSNASTSLLMSTKAVADTKTHPWLMDNVTKKLTSPCLVTIMNDFFDGATADAAFNLSKERFG